MKRIKLLAGAAALITSLAGGLVAADHKHGDKPKIKPYPLTTCLVSGEKLGSMGAPFAHQHQDREIKFCCKGCLKDFNKDTATYLKKLEAAEEKHKH